MSFKFYLHLLSAEYGWSKLYLHVFVHPEASWISFPQFAALCLNLRPQKTMSFRRENNLQIATRLPCPLKRNPPPWPITMTSPKTKGARVWTVPALTWTLLTGPIYLPRGTPTRMARPLISPSSMWVTIMGNTTSAPTLTKLLPPLSTAKQYLPETLRSIFLCLFFITLNFPSWLPAWKV